MDNTKELKHISLCTGYAGIDIGLSRALGDIRTVSYVEIEAFVIENLVAKIEGGWLDPAPVFTDLKTFPWELFSGKVDILSGGFPCQPFSAAGKRKGSEDPRHLWPYITDGIKRLGRPPIVFFENVEGIISSKLKGDDWADPEGTSVLHHVLKELERLGYAATAGVFSAREVGAPHQRKRVFILGVRDGLRESGRDLISSMLERGREPSVGNSESWDGSRPLWGRKPELEGVQLSLRESGTAYPAPRGAEQYPWEPPRVTVGNSKHKGSHGVESTILSSQATNRETSGPQWAGACNRLDNTDQQRLLRNKDESSDTHSEGREAQIRHDAETSTSPRGVQRETEPEVGGDTDGSSHRLDYAELCQSTDNRTDELRLLGNGVVPDTAERAFRVLWGKLAYSFSFSKG